MGKHSVINVEVEAYPGEDGDALIKRFSKKVKKSRILERFREGLVYVKPSMQRRMKKIRREEVQKKLQGGRKVYYKNNYL